MYMQFYTPAIASENQSLPRLSFFKLLMAIYSEVSCCYFCFSTHNQFTQTTVNELIVAVVYVCKEVPFWYVQKCNDEKQLPILHNSFA